MVAIFVDDDWKLQRVLLHEQYNFVPQVWRTRLLSLRWSCSVDTDPCRVATWQIASDVRWFGAWQQLLCDDDAAFGSSYKVVEVEGQPFLRNTAHCGATPVDIGLTRRGKPIGAWLVRLGKEQPRRPRCHIALFESHRTTVRLSLARC